MSINTVKRALRSLPYTEMKALGDQIVATILERYWKPETAYGQQKKHTLEPDHMCDVLATLPVAEPEQLENEDVFLARALTTKRGAGTDIRLKPLRAGRDITAWEAKAGEFSATEATVRSAVSALLDQIAAYEALVKS